jgi:hypothetical protein
MARGGEAARGACGRVSVRLDHALDLGVFRSFVVVVGAAVLVCIVRRILVVARHCRRSGPRSASSFSSGRDWCAWEYVPPANPYPEAMVADLVWGFAVRR